MRVNIFHGTTVFTLDLNEHMFSYCCFLGRATVVLQCL